MKAITEHYGAGESAVLAALAGVDVILFSHTRALQEEAYQALLEAARSERIPRENLVQSAQRIQTMKDRFALAVSEIQPERVGNDRHRAKALEAARAGVIAARQGKCFPLNTLPDDTDIGLIEFGTHIESEVMGAEAQTTLQTHLRAQWPRLKSVRLNARSPVTSHIQQARTVASVVDVLVVATRNAHMQAAQKALADDLLALDVPAILVCLRNPYDADVLHADTVICTCGDSVPSLRAVAEALAGDFQPTGTRPVTGEA
jgi:beta-N-acetylhexosaminidase